MKEDPPPDAKCRDKFLVQSVAVTADKEFSNVPSIVRSPSKHLIFQSTNGFGSGSKWTKPPNPRWKRRKLRLFSCLQKAKCMLHISVLQMAMQVSGLNASTALELTQNLAFG